MTRWIFAAAASSRLPAMPASSMAREPSIRSSVRGEPGAYNVARVLHVLTVAMLIVVVCGALTAVPWLFRER